MNQLDQSLTNHGLKVNDSEHLQEREEPESEVNEESSESEPGSEMTPFTTPGLDSPDAPHITSEQRAHVQQLLNDLREGRKPLDDSEQTQMDQTLDHMNYRDFPTLRQAKAHSQ